MNHLEDVLFILSNILHLKSHDISFVTIARGGFNLSVPEIMGDGKPLNPNDKLQKPRFG